MRKKERKAVITFQNTTSAMAMEKLCKEQGLNGRLIPVPRCITAGCGLAFSANPQARFELENFMKESHIIYDKIYDIEI
ncbi:MAG TPA: phytoene dehydrogenase [Lachnoclostridium phytofermentans]|uniref:Phytoene dehydrogenase n=1 Tax=Lachnoclostridium phytofermentans TaxID=66219 RepID=A0A3D2X4X1_9FIRM|nr:DUF3343 domain-containing protein [Lachnoclostridium sp.]HCL01605.1 phytoene dehydrogenase [Lachnoclostridium phytofermentans]